MMNLAIGMLIAEMVLQEGRMTMITRLISGRYFSIFFFRLNGTQLLYNVSVRTNLRIGETSLQE